MNYIKSIFITLVTLLIAAGCNKDKTPSLELDQVALYFNDWGAPAQVVSFIPTNTVRVAEVSISEGWQSFIDNNSHKIVVTPVGNTEEGGSNDELSKNGTLHINALSKSGDHTGYTIYLYICDEKKLDADGHYANSYIVTKPDIKYTFEANVKPDGTPLNTKSVELLWQSNKGAIDNVNYYNGNVSFFVNPSEGDYTKVFDTNAVIAAYDEDEDIVWSWHIWITDSDPTLQPCEYSNGAVFMGCNLGAFVNSNGSDKTDLIYDSYGLYYQWGRKDPFPRPQTYDCSGGNGETVYNEYNIYYAEEESLETSYYAGTIEYATENPMCFITNDTDDDDDDKDAGDWLYTADNSLWKDDVKTLQDPCPYGWKVPSASELAVLHLTDSEDATELDKARKQYGWWLSDGTNNFFYNACGYRRYNDGKIQNMNYHPSFPSTPEPWEGYYWSSTANTDGSAASLYFDLTTTRTVNKFESNRPSRRANGMQVRCVKIK